MDKKGTHTRTCKTCGQPFTPKHGRGGNNQRYCSQHCRVRGYHRAKLEAKRRYRERRKPVLNCKWCGKQFISHHGREYCSEEHKKYALEEQSRRSSILYLIRGVSEKANYFKHLGNSNLREHRHEDFEDEARLIKAERRRLQL